MHSVQWVSANQIEGFQVEHSGQVFLEPAMAMYNDVWVDAHLIM